MPKGGKGTGGRLLGHYPLRLRGVVEIWGERTKKEVFPGGGTGSSEEWKTIALESVLYS